MRLIFRNVDRRELSLRCRSASRYVGTYCLSVTEGLDRESCVISRASANDPELRYRFSSSQRKKKRETRILRNGSFVSRQCYTVSVASYSFLDRRFGRFSRRNQIMIDHRILKVSSHNDFPFVFVLASRTTRFSLDSISFAPGERDFIVRDDNRTCDASNFPKTF